MSFKQVCSGEFLCRCGEALVTVRKVPLLAPHSQLRELLSLQPVFSELDPTCGEPSSQVSILFFSKYRM